MAKLSLAAAPTFQAKVSIPVPGGKPVSISFTFKGRSKDEFKEYMETLAELSDVEAIMDTASGWDLEDAFGEENVAKLLQAYIGAAKAIFEKYISEISGARLGN